MRFVSRSSALKAIEREMGERREGKRELVREKGNEAKSRE